MQDILSLQHPVASLDSQTVNSMTPATSLRKPSYRPSMVPQPQSSTNVRQSLAPGRGLSGLFVRPNGVGGADAPRPSAISVLNPPTSARAPRPSSIARPSSFGIGSTPFGASTGVGFSATPASGHPAMRDPRPLRDKAYHANMLQKINEYLVANNFEIEMKHPLTPKTLKTPTQKDFVMLFQWMYRRMDPGYKFAKSIEHEVYFLLRLINYPYLESINKSQIAAVGGQNWPVFLGMLFWMVQLNQTLETYEWNNEQAEKSDETMLSQILDRYASRSYRAYLANEHDFSEYKTEVRKEISEFSESIRSSIEEARGEIGQLQKRKDELEKEAEGYNALERKREALESDLVKFQAYIDAMESRKTKWNSVLEKITDELTKSQQELHEVETIGEALQSQIHEQGLSPQDIDNMNTERETLSKNLELIAGRHEELLKLNKEREVQAHRLHEALEASLQRYTTLLYRTGLSSTSDIDLNISILPPFTEENLGLRPEALLHNKELRNHIRPSIIQQRHVIGQRLHRTQDECIRLQEENDRINESLIDKREQVESLEAKLHMAKIAYDELYENMNSEAVASNAKIEKMERELQMIMSGPQQQLLRLTQRAKAIEIEYEEIEGTAMTAKASMNKEIDRMIHYLIEFKIHVQTSLEDYENLVEQEHSDFEQFFSDNDPDNE
jgi:kinetochore protein NDC80